MVARVRNNEWKPPVLFKGTHFAPLNIHLGDKLPQARFICQTCQSMRSRYAEIKSEIT
ncbi:hypothetical protein HYDPIDRAFT_116755 [Hydnomerulius pinastri MD-312]|uniref:Uncharacterized protein n=1 Tax=Hydnomerulius pinastri MD-312 TaxID=994086 RepID=A0A0C9WAV4_9AGAM|nr:hypothetical protein HYDPIDRAFT_116755 [Hydnomerulius pinastri MD-312]